jgi:hypothetical protein
MGRMGEQGEMRRWDRPDASMSLLADLLAGTGLEPGYEAAAVRRAASGDRRSRYGAGARLFAATLVLGLLGAVAVAQVRRGEPVAERQRRALIAQIRPLSPPYAVTAAGDPGTIENAFADSPAGRAFRLAGTLPATGPGIELTINDPQGRVRSAALLDTLEELRDAGAEVIQVGDVRVGVNTYFADGQSLTRPYRLLAIGDPHTLATALNIPGGVLQSLRNSGADGVVGQQPKVTVQAVRSP